MAVPSVKQQSEPQSDRDPLLMEQPVNRNVCEHVIDISRGSIASTSIPNSGDDRDSDDMRCEDRPSTSTQVPVHQSTTVASSVSNARDVSLTRRGDTYGRRHRSPLNSGLWISIEFVVNVSQVIAAIVVLSLSRNEHPKAPLFSWIIGYTAGCIVTLPHLCWRYIYRNSQGTEQDLVQLRQSSQSNPLESNAYTTIMISEASRGENHQSASTASTFRWNLLLDNTRLNSLVDHFKMALDCFFAIWFVVGNVWIFGGHSSAADAPYLYRLCIVFLTFSCIGYAMPFVLCATICCCLPCIVSILSVREDMNQNKGATPELINALPTYKFKAKRGRSGRDSGANSEGVVEGGILAAGTNQERIIASEDAVCCICLAKYADNERLRELPCAHFFHKDCVDKWLKINALCPLCKFEVGGLATAATNVSRRHSERRVGSDVERQ